MKFVLQDKFIIGSMVFNWLVCLWHAILSQYADNSNQADMDKIAFFTLIGLLGFFHLVFWLLVLIKVIKLFGNLLEKRYSSR